MLRPCAGSIPGSCRLFLGHLRPCRDGARRELAGVVRLPGDWTPADLAGERCVVYVRSSLCSSPEGRPLCDAAEAQLPLTPLARTALPAVPSRSGLTYDRDPVEVGLSRVRRAP